MMKKIVVFLLGLGLGLASLSATAHASVNDFYITNYDISYHLSRAQDTHSVLTTKETITADFPLTDQSHGIERAIPSVYDGHPTKLKITSVTDGQGTPRHYTTYQSGDMLVVRIGDAGTYVHGTQTYVVSYTQQYATKHFADTKSDEFYWDTNGTAWQVPIDSLHVSLQLDDGLAGSLTDRTACYTGAAGSTDHCALTRRDNVFETSAGPLLPGENVTIAVGFNPNTFAAYQAPWYVRVINYAAAMNTLMFPVTIILLLWLIIVYRRRSNRKSEQHTIIPEYLPPEGTSVSVAADLVQSSKGFAAQLIDLAVRHYIRIYQTKQKKGLFGKDEYAIEVVKSPRSLLPEEKELLSDIFNGLPNAGSKINLADLQKSRTAFSLRLSDNSQKLGRLIRGRYSLRAKSDTQSAWFRRVAKWLFIISVLLLSPVLLPAIITAFVFSFTIRPLTDKGVELVRYLRGLKLYIKVAEEERLRMLQSPEGAAKVGVIGDDKTQLVKLYERVLPYAILFGQEKEWNKQLGRYYETLQTQPDWYVGSPGMAAFSAASFSSAISSFSSTAYATSASSSSSGGSSGGGFSGGGGGGGGGGGW